MDITKLLNQAQNEGFAIGAFNASDLVTVRGIVQAAKAFHSPAIIESSPSETQFIGAKNLVDVVGNYRDDGLSLFVNLDHATSLASVEDRLKDGYNLIHFDGSALEFDENLAKTREAVALAHAQGVLVEAEIDKITGESRPHRESAESFQAAGVYTDPEKAALFAQESGADIFAVFIGNVHGVYKDPVKLDIKRLKLIREKVTCFLSLHGGSGIPAEEIKKVIEVGRVVKINVSTEIRVAYRSALEKSLAESEEVAPYKIMEPVVQAVQRVVEEKMKMFGSVGKA